MKIFWLTFLAVVSSISFAYAYGATVYVNNANNQEISYSTQLSPLVSTSKSPSGVIPPNAEKAELYTIDPAGSTDLAKETIEITFHTADGTTLCKVKFLLVSDLNDSSNKDDQAANCTVDSVDDGFSVSVGEIQAAKIANF